MSDRAPVRRNAGAALPPASAEPAVVDRDSVLELIERTAETIRSLQQDNERIGAREQAWRAQLARDRANWRDDLETLKVTVESGLERAAAAEIALADAKTHARLAIQFCKEARIREQDALARAEAAEERADRAERVLAELAVTA